LGKALVRDTIRSLARFVRNWQTSAGEGLRCRVWNVIVYLGNKIWEAHVTKTASRDSKGPQR